ncbi:hypothetical protein BV501_13735 [Erwinia sp. OAMSP11]|nr:hypothetical protein BV501_13735 [Erwinia sp. OAMSP11]PIJ79910.1 hypothetical protein BLD47_12615 [Erwinia sp. OLCASP19]PIJ81078.1 hypothetical protein BLD46_13425 [Erwinia sp. OLMTSP26]PIJ93134.1 hypothetical protein BL249_05270 [Erwinia sp. OLFS4]
MGEKVSVQEVIDVMNVKKQGLSTSQAVLLIALLFIGAVTIGLLISWILLNGWNMFAHAAGFNAVIPINWVTVIGSYLIYSVLRSIFSSTKNNQEPLSQRLLTSTEY